MNVPVNAAVDEPVLLALRAALPPGTLLAGADIPHRNRADWSGLPPADALALVRPATTAEVSDVLRVCHAHGRAVVPQGGLTGLSGGGHPLPGCVLLSLERMAGVEEVDTAAATLTALAGTPLQQVHDAAEAAGFSCGIDLGARGSCAVGGNVATNAGGNNVLRYGTTRQNVRGLEVVLPDGQVVSALAKYIKNNAGYDWPQLFIGSEGTLGVITRVVLALHPAVRDRSTALCAVSGFPAALRVLRRLEASLPGQLLAFEAMWDDYWRFSTGTVGVPAPMELRTPLALLIEASRPVSSQGGEDRLGPELEALFEAGLVEDAVVAQSETERRAFWAVREAPPGEYPRFLPGLLPMDVSLPLADMEAAVAELRGVLARCWPGGTALFYGHVADSNLHLVVGPAPDGRSPKGVLEDELYGVVARYAGSVSAEHGIGLLKRPWLARSRSPAELALMATMKRALDPRNILNPGKVL